MVWMVNMFKGHVNGNKPHMPTESTRYGLTTVKRKKINWRLTLYPSLLRSFRIVFLKFRQEAVYCQTIVLDFCMVVGKKIFRANISRMKSVNYKIII